MTSSFSLIRLTEDNRSCWASMGDYQLVSPDGTHSINIEYEGEPPHGDSYHLVRIDNEIFPGYAWGCMFGFSQCSRYATFSWMLKRYERHTVVVDMRAKRYFVLPKYIYEFRIDWPCIVGEGNHSTGERYVFAGDEHWLSYGSGRIDGKSQVTPIGLWRRLRHIFGSKRS